MFHYFACAFVVTSATVLPVPAVAGVQSVVRVAMLESPSPGAVPGQSSFSPRNVENVALSARRYPSSSVIAGPTYFSALRRYERHQLQVHQRLQGFGCGTVWSAKPR